MTRREVAQETLKVVADGRYQVAGKEVVLHAAIAAAVQGTVLYEPAQLEALDAEVHGAEASTARIEVSGETTATAARRLIMEGEQRVLALNFASAKNPGGGFLGGAKAQEEDLARCSALYTCQLEQPRFYAENRRASLLYTDHLIYSPDVPFFRDEALQLITEPFLVSVITSPAPNAGEVARQQPASLSRVAEVLRVRAGHILSVARARGHRTLVLGAWGCGVFRNDPALVAEAFAGHLQRFGSAFERVVFAVYDKSPGQPNLRAFEQRFGPRA